MAAPKGNKFWQNRSRHGREKIFETPELMWDAATEYFQWCDENPWMKAEGIKSGDLCGQIMQVPTARPYTLSGLCLYLGTNTGYFTDFKANLKPTEKEIDKDFSRVINEIEQVIYTQKFEGAAVGTFNANIIARDLGLRDGIDNKHSGEIKTESVVTLFEIPNNGRRGIETKDNQAAAGVSDPGAE